jgi:hypothetical protein
MDVQFLKLLSFNQIRTNIEQNTLSRKTNSILQYVVLLALTGFMSSDRCTFQTARASCIELNCIQDASLHGAIQERQ